MQTARSALVFTANYKNVHHLVGATGSSDNPVGHPPIVRPREAVDARERFAN
jgi:hypothetical protein